MNTDHNNFWSTFGIIGCGLMLLICLLLCSCFGLFFFAVLSSESEYTKQGFTESEQISGNQDEKIAVIYLEGIILDVEDGVYETSLTQYVLDSFDTVIEDDNYKGVILVLNTPGGGVFDSARIVDKIKKAQEKEKLVVSVIEDMAASGGYWVAAPTDYIFIQPESITGSVGVLFETVEYEELFNKIGLDEIIITNKESINKVPENLDDKNSDQYKIFEELLDETYDQFVQLIVDGRGLSRAEMTPYIDGRLISGKVAVDKKFADEFGGLDEAVGYIAEEKGLDSPEVVDFYRTELFAWNSISSKLNILTKQLNPESHAKIEMYLLPEIMFKEKENL